MNVSSQRAVVLGIGGSLAMIPFGLLLCATGHRANVRGETLIRTLLGRSSPGPMPAQHLALGAVAAVPLSLA